MNQNKSKLLVFIYYWLIASLILFILLSISFLTGLAGFTIEEPISIDAYVSMIFPLIIASVLFGLIIGGYFLFKKYRSINIEIINNSIKITQNNIFGEINIKHYNSNDIEYIKHIKNNYDTEDNHNLLMINPKEDKSIIFPYNSFDKPFYIKLHEFSINNGILINGFEKDEIEYDKFEKEHDIYSTNSH